MKFNLAEANNDIVLYNFFLVIKSLYLAWTEARKAIYNKKMQNGNKLFILDNMINEFHCHLYLNQTLVLIK